MPLLLSPVPPYDFSLSCRIFSTGDPEIRSYKNGIFRQVITVNGKLMLVQVRSVEEVDSPALAVNIRAKEVITDEEREEAGTAVSRGLSLPDDLTRFYRNVAGDPTMAALTGELYGLKAPTTQTVFEALVTSVIEQQISIQVARALEARLVKRFGESLEVKEGTFFAYPTPGALARGSPEDFRASGLSARKGEYIRNAAEMVVDGSLDLEHFHNIRDADSIIEELCGIRGIGRWTAEFVLLRGLHRLETIPADDLGVKRAIARVYCPGSKISADQARKISERWGEWKGLAAFYLLMAEHPGILPRKG